MFNLDTYLGPCYLSDAERTTKKQEEKKREMGNL